MCQKILKTLLHAMLPEGKFSQRGSTLDLRKILLVTLDEIWTVPQESTPVGGITTDDQAFYTRIGDDNQSDGAHPTILMQLSSR